MLAHPLFRVLAPAAYVLGLLAAVAWLPEQRTALLAAGLLLLVPGYREMELAAAAVAAIAWSAFALAGRPTRELRQ